VVAVGRDSAAAKDAARSMVGIYASSMPAEQLERNGVDPDSLKPIIDAIGGGDLARGIELTTPEIAEKLSFAGTPDEVTAKIKEIEPAGVNHLIAAITDASLVKAFTGRELPGVATVEEQLRLLHDEVMPAFERTPAGAVAG
jgi:5,10-methylenetetrahydromethanopterin reductase